MGMRGVFGAGWSGNTIPEFGRAWNCLKTVCDIVHLNRNLGTGQWGHPLEVLVKTQIPPMTDKSALSISSY